MASPRFLASAAPALHIVLVGINTGHQRTVTERSAGADTRCQHPACGEPGLHRGPKSRSRIDEYYLFCLQGVRAYNMAWDYCTGFSEADVEAQVRAQDWWERPTWRMGGWHSYRPEAAMAGFAKAFGIEGDDKAGDNRSRHQEQPETSSEEGKALTVL